MATITEQEPSVGSTVTVANLERDPRQHAGQVFRDTLAPLLALADDYPDATELVVDGDRIRLDLGIVWRNFVFADFPGLRSRDVRAAAAAAAVFAGIQFGQQPPAKPTMSVKIPPDLRVSVVCPPVAEQWNLSIRFLRSRALTLADYVAAAIMTDAQADQLRAILAARQNLVISGATSSGKTTLLRCLLEIVAHQRLIIIEDTPELSVRGSSDGENNVLHWCTTAEIDMAALLRQAMRMRPGRLVVGEVRGPEALELCRASNTGHRGVLSTIHSNGERDALRRLHTLTTEAQTTFPASGVASAIDYVAQLEGRGAERRLASIWKVPREDHGP